MLIVNTQTTLQILREKDATCFDIVGGIDGQRMDVYVNANKTCYTYAKNGGKWRFMWECTYANCVQTVIQGTVYRHDANGNVLGCTRIIGIIPA